eukprot:scaffold156833_cov23-Tisochrysis_lutea.AAC.1
MALRSAAAPQVACAGGWREEDSEGGVVRLRCHLGVPHRPKVWRLRSPTIGISGGIILSSCPRNSRSGEVVGARLFKRRGPREEHACS